MSRFRRGIAGVAAVAASIGIIATSGVAAAGPSSSGPTPLQQAVNEQIQRAPSGTQTSANTVSYDNGHMLVIVAVPSASTSASPFVTGSCPSGWFCIWANTNKGGNRYQWQDTGVFDDLAAYGVPEPYGSYQNNRSARMFMHEYNHSTPEQCYTGGTYVSSALPWYNAAYAIYLATSASC
jgi:Peptidase inhibitor family I36